MLLASRNAFASRLLYDAEMEYLESTGTQWIDTGWLPQANKFYEIYVDFQFTAATNDTDLMGLRATSGSNEYIMVFSSYGGFRAFQNVLIASADTKRHIYHYGKLIDGVRKATFDGVAKYNCLTTWPSIVTDRTFPLYGRKWYGNVASYKGSSRIFEFWVKNNNGDKLVDFIPVRVGSGINAVGYMYDRVSGKLFGNQGTGEFVLGPDKLSNTGGATNVQRKRSRVKLLRKSFSHNNISTKAAFPTSCFSTSFNLKGVAA